MPERNTISIKQQVVELPHVRGRCGPEFPLANGEASVCNARYDILSTSGSQEKDHSIYYELFPDICLLTRNELKLSEKGYKPISYKSRLNITFLQLKAYLANLPK